MSGEAWLYLFAVLINAVNLFLQVFFTIMYSDLEWYVGYLSPFFLKGFYERTHWMDSASRARCGLRPFLQQTATNGTSQRLHQPY